ncbi:MAG: UDP-N-acetylmuramoyl-L-alanine--D-glutamate ligase [Aeriscardovia sp.]|nr:UDP-N-acetylmuramoyl-L-alanine--D-glutamate ligase [Aeriscardovia sp.]
MAIIGRGEFLDTVLVAGLGVSGLAVKELLEKEGVKCETFDEKGKGDFSNPGQVDWENITAVVASPGFSPTSKLMKAIEENHVPLMSEVEFAWKTRPRDKEGRSIPWVGVTGTNGKTTTVKMITKIFEECGICVAEGGNTGFPLTKACRKPGAQVVVAELSSSQLHFTRSLALEVAVWTNFAQDHLDWHRSMEEYRRDKAKVFENAKRAVIYNASDPVTAGAAKSANVNMGCVEVGFSLKKPAPAQVGIEDGWIFDNAFAYGRVCKEDSLSGLKLAGSVPSHRLENALAACAATLAMGVKPEDVAMGLSKFRPEAHRLEDGPCVPKDGGKVEFIDDSKATNPASALATLNSLEGKGIIWIVGGEAKNCDMRPLLEKAKGKVKEAILIGKEREEFAKALSNARIPFTQIEEEEGSGAMKRAVEAAYKKACPGDVVLLAPACASRDQFRDMAERGDKFREFANALEGDLRV